MHQQSIYLILFDIQILQQVLPPGLVNVYSIDPAKLYNIAQKIENSCIMRAKSVPNFICILHEWDGDNTFLVYTNIYLYKEKKQVKSWRLTSVLMCLLFLENCFCCSLLVVSFSVFQNVESELLPI